MELHAAAKTSHVQTTLLLRPTGGLESWQDGLGRGQQHRQMSKTQSQYYLQGCNLAGQSM